MSERPTPETDARTYVPSLGGATVPAEFARQLERERDEAREALSDWENAALHVEANHPDENHCGCVPVLRKLLTEAREKGERYQLEANAIMLQRDEARKESEYYKERYEQLKEIPKWYNGREIPTDINEEAK